MNHNIITIGSRTFTGNTLKSGSCFIAESVAGEELAIDTLTATVESAENLKVLTYGEPVFYKYDNTLVGKFYLSSVNRGIADKYDLSCVSAVGVLAGSMHLGGLYTGQTASVVLADIVGGLTAYTVSDAVKNVKVYGWLPYATRRENLHQLLFALGASITKNLVGTLDIKYLSAENPAVISADRLYIGGSIDYRTPATEARVTEHAYFSTSADRSNTLFDNTDGSIAVVGQLVTFDGPHHDLSATSGLTIVSSGVNHAVVSGIGVLTGKAYTHQTKIVAKKSDGSGSDRVITVTDATLVSAANSENVAERVLGYYSSAYNVTVGLVVGEERPGSPIAYTNPFRETDTGIIKSMDINMSNTLKADAVISSGYRPSGGGGNNFSQSVVLTGSGQWTVPAGVKKIRAIMIGGGQGGQGGAKGSAGLTGKAFSNGTSMYGAHGYYWGEGGAGGKAGNGGSGGKVYEIEFTTIPGVALSYSAGNGGSGGAGETSGAAQKSGGDGAASVFNGNSSESGSIRQSGYVDLFTGNVYAKSGTAGADGGKGSGSSPDDGETIVPGDTLIDTNSNTWGPGIDAGITSQSGDSARINMGAGGGSGGGAAIGVRGGNGSTGSASVSLTSGTYYARATGGNGGTGATPVSQLSQPDLGAGGLGGNGGGGGGGSGEASIFKKYSSTPPTISETINQGTPGSGGNGGIGGLGGSGCIIIYY